MAGFSRAGTLKWIAINIRSSFWFVPGLLILAGIALAAGLVGVSDSVNLSLAKRWPRMFAAEAEGSRAMLSAIASSMITVAGVVFSITIVALAQAATQYTSRVLRNFMRDRLNQVVLGVFVGVFTYCLIVLRAISGSDNASGFVPALAVFVGLVLAIVAIGFLIVFIHHISTSIQAGEIARSVMLDTVEAIDRLFPDDIGHEADAPPQAEVPACGCWHPVPATETGYVQSVLADSLLEYAIRNNTVVRMEASVGEFVIKGRPIAHLARETPPDRKLVHEFNALYAVDAFRTTDQDPSYGLRQLVDVALKALSPGINDTTTAVTCIDHLSALLQRLAARRIASPYRSEDSHLRVIARGHDFADFVELALAQILENAEGNTAVLMRLLRCVKEVAEVTASRARRRVLAARIDVIEEVALRSAKSSHARTLLVRAVRDARSVCDGEDNGDHEPARA